MNQASLVAADRGPAQRDGTAGGGRYPYPIAFALLFTSYAVAAWGGLHWATIAGAASPIWPASGIAVAGLLLAGRRLFPAIFLAVLVAIQVSGAQHSWLSQLIIAAGNAAGAVAAVTLIRRVAEPGFDRLATIRDVLLLIAAAALASAISTFAGVGALLGTGVLAPPELFAASETWFFGDAVGILTVTALVLSTLGTSDDDLPGRASFIHLCAALLILAALCVMVFFGDSTSRSWAVYPALVWLALAFRVRGAALALLLLSTLACVGTIKGYGPFVPEPEKGGLILLQQYLAVTAVTTLLLAAAMDERNTQSRLRQIAAEELATRRKLQRTTSLLNLIGDAAPSLIYAKDLEGRFIYGNRALLTLYERTAEEVLGRTDLELTSTEQAENFRANDRMVVATGEPTEVEEDLTVDGKVRTYFSVKAPLRQSDGEIAGIVGISTDVTERREQEKELQRLARRAEIAQRGARSSLYEFDLVTGEVVRDPVMSELCGLKPDGLAPTKEGWETHLHPADLPQFRQTIASALAGYERFALEYRVVGDDGRITWVSDTGTILRDEAGQPIEVIGLVTDVTAQKIAEERERLLAREVDHRAKNLLAVVQSVVQLTRAEDSEQLKAGIIGRIQSLARAHSLLADARWEGVELTGLAREEVAPYAEEQDARVTLDGPPLLLRPAAAQSIALVLHELATNAAKYGALASSNGQLELSWSIGDDGRLLLVWQERGGSASRDKPPTRSGFGSRLIKASIERQLRGTVSYDWAAPGLTVNMTIAPEYFSLGERDGITPA
ncbi:PAS domain-containing protein [Sphingomonas sp. KRR8]|uniref:PAS domain-containing protein n=1 Tax=Sphingomonas sp. KRR8 TaxID=2942996 RepID=UPI0020215FE9|nr:PAS domain-containing protein [Sphingomonas sp. KRR8]URD60642.1 PAS domain-containing protein [Sphingomonas sp. KRR8]